MTSEIATATATPPSELVELAETQKSAHAKPDYETTLEETDDTPQTPPARYALTLFAMCLFIFVAGFDFTAVVMVLPNLGIKFSNLKSLNWVVTAYMLALAVILPSARKISAILSYRASIAVFTLLYIAGLLMSGASNEFRLLLAGRGIAGVGAAGCIAISLILVSETGSRKQRVGGLRVLLFAWNVASVLGLVAGSHLGVSTRSAHDGSWRWVFYLSCILLFVALVPAVIFADAPLPRGRVLEDLARIDFVGTLLVTGAVLTLILALNFGGDLFNWASGVVITLIVLSVVLFALFVFVQAKFSREPIFARSMFASRSSAALVSAQPFVGMAIYTPVVYLALWYHVVKNEEQSKAGEYMLAIVLTALGASAAVSAAISRTARYAPFVWMSGVLLTLGCGLLLVLKDTTSGVSPVGLMVVLGLGIGLSIEPHITALHASLPARPLADTISLLLSLRLLGGTICIAMFNTIMQNNLTTKLAAVVLDHALYYKYILMSVDNHDVILLPSVPQSVKDDVTHANAEAFKSAFVCCLVFAAVTIPFCLFVRHVPLSGKLRNM
ncbi:hypothetical protein GGI15_000260 [Coemansia interrupta]|uniref:Major facilitator superfamily (MFS) profile domain-containing protein n=1 Tax=Coemansia interrupta TaxID=1126814 RepID=A0A9W8LMI8_9FUNG|nr:hypothetical protein GGI15_000260 [Coemansia interrupta]